MNHLVVRNLFNAVKELADYIDKEDIRGHVAYAVGMNVNILEAEVKAQTSGAPKRLREIEEKIILEGSEAFKSLSDEDKANFKTDQAIKTRIMILGKEKLSDEEKDEYQTANFRGIPRVMFWPISFWI
jgi:hypothetical protein